MSIYKMPHAGTKLYRTRRNFRPHKQFTLQYGEVFPVTAKFVLPGDVWKISAGAMIRMRPMLAPTLTKQSAFFRFFFVPLRQVVDNLEEIITGSKNGSLITDALPTCPNFVKEWINVAGTPSTYNNQCVNHKYSFWSALGVRPNIPWYTDPQTPASIKFSNYSSEVDASDFPAAYWYKAYCKIIWEYFRDENYQSFDGDFEKFYEYMLCHKHASDVSTNAWWLSGSEYTRFQVGGDGVSYSDYRDFGVTNFKLWIADIRKDYFMSSLPWILKGVQPTINSVMHADFTDSVSNLINGDTVNNIGLNVTQKTLYTHNGSVNNTNNDVLVTALNKAVIADASFTANDIRDMFAETRVFERLARCGSRYVEYLESNFGIAPRDDTLQRPLYLGGFEQPIVTTEVVQTGGSSDGDVGTLRGHGISSGGNRIKPFVATEFGMVFGLMYITPQTQYLYQMKRELSYKSRFDFVNPSFQLLSEQEVGNLEMFTPRLDNESGSDFVMKKIPRFTLGFQGMYNELRYDNDIVCRDLADTDSFWTQSLDPGKYYVNGSELEYTDTPPLNGHNISLAPYLRSLLRPFHSVDGSVKPFIIDYQLNAEVWRPLVKDPIPSLTDHN